MSRTLENLQESGHFIDEGYPAVVSIHPEVRIGIRYENEIYILRMSIIIGDQVIAVAETIAYNLDDFAATLGIGDLDEVWEILDK